MSHRPIIEKKIARIRKAVERRPLPLRIDLVDWLQTHGHAQTAGAARQLLIDGRVKAESHVVGRSQIEDVWFVDPLVDAGLRKALWVTE